MRIRFGLNNSPVNKLKKSVIWTPGGDREGSLVDRCSITDPVIRFEAGPGAWTNVNYFHVPDFGRYYFIRKVVSIRTGIVEVTGHVDVLNSFRSELLENDAIFRNLQVSGRTFGYNTYVNDGSFRVYQDRYIINKYEFPNGFDHSEYVLAMAGS